MEKKNVLIFPAGTEIAFEIHNALKYSKFVTLFGGTSVDDHSEFVFKRLIKGFPFVDRPGFIDYMNKVIDEYGIDYIYPAHDSVVLSLTQSRGSLHAEVVTSDLKTVEICRSKSKTYDYLSGAWYLPKVFPSAESVSDYPVFVKPSVGQGSVGAKKISSEEELLREIESNKDLVICEYLPGVEFTVDCFTDRHGALRVAKPRSRDRIRAGISVRSTLLPEDDAIKQIAEDINTKFDFNGAWFFQLKKNLAGEYRLMEISPRVPGTMGLSRNLGVNFPLLTLYNMWGMDIDIIDNAYDEILDRAFISRYGIDMDYDEVYVDFDDTIIVDGLVNVFLMAFLFQCKNKGKKIYLLTKHVKDIHESLKAYHIDETLFDEILHIKPDMKKTDYITSRSAVFIDDSFSERKKVREECGIPVFDLDMVESLIDWRL